MLHNKKEKNFSEWYTELVSEAGAQLADIRYGVQGFVAHRPLAVKIIRTFEKMIEDEVEKDGYEPILLPVLIPKKNIDKEKEHVEFTPELFWVEKMGDTKLEEPLYMRPTGESQIYPMYSIWLRSWKDLPYKKYQSRICTYRAESVTRPFLRGREFVFFETHGVFASHNEILKQVKKDIDISEKVVRQRLGIPFIFFKRPAWEKFKGAADTYAADVLMPDGKMSQIASTHDLGQKFAKAYNITYVDEKEKRQYGWQTCYGPGIWRIMAAIIGLHGDNYGLVLPFEIAPVQIVIIPILFEKKSAAVYKKCKQLEKTLKEKGFRVKYDDSENTAGWKFNEWEMIGVPIRIEVGPREVKEKKLTIVRRDMKKKEIISEKVLIKKVLALEKDILKNMRGKAEKDLKSRIFSAKTFDEAKKVLERQSGFVKVPWCSMDADGAGCADKLKEKIPATKVSGTLYGKQEKASGRCLMCGRPAKHMVYIAKSY